MSKATETDTHSPALPMADSHDLIRVLGARENNLKDVTLELLDVRRFEGGVVHLCYAPARLGQH
jgi:hypothetical protein